MKAFSFRLDSALRWRLTQLELAKECVARAAGHLVGLQSELVSRHNEFRRSATELASVGTPAFGSWAAYGDLYRRRIRMLESQVSEARKAVAEHTEKMVEAHRKVRVLENLKRDELAKWSQDLGRETEAFAGEVFLARLQSKSGRARSSSG